MTDGPVTLSAETYDRFRDGYVALLEALSEARHYVADARHQSASQRELLQRIDLALAMKANLTKEKNG